MEYELGTYQSYNIQVFVTAGQSFLRCVDNVIYDKREGQKN
jgi:hypothetical protein